MGVQDMAGNVPNGELPNGEPEIQRVTLDDLTREESELTPSERVTVGDLLRQESEPPPRELGPLTRVGYRLAIFLLIYISIVTVILLGDMFFNAPELTVSAELTPEDMERYRELVQLSESRTINLLDTLVLKGFLPVFAAVLGYIFGTRGSDG